LTAGRKYRQVQENKKRVSFGEGESKGDSERELIGKFTFRKIAKRIATSIGPGENRWRGGRGERIQLVLNVTKE